MKSATRMKSKTAFSVGERMNEIPKDRDEVTDVMKSTLWMKSKTCVFGWVEDE